MSCQPDADRVSGIVSTRRLELLCGWVVLSVCLGGSLDAQAQAPGDAWAQALSQPDWSAPNEAPMAPGDPFGPVFSTQIQTRRAPVISAWPEAWVGPDESFTLTGIRFTRYSGQSAGKDTTVWIYAEGSGVVEADVWRVTESCLTATLPTSISDGLFLVWVANENGVSAPIALNRTRGLWLGPLGNSRAAGDTLRLFGKNLCHDNLAAAGNAADIYVQSSTGGAFIPCSTTAHQTNPYAVEFTLPVSLSTGNYFVYAHNGHGGDYGWSEPVDLSIDNDPWVRGSSVVNVPPPTGNSTTDYNNIQSAIDTVSTFSDGGTVQLAVGTYTIYKEMSLEAKVRLAGMGMTQTTIAVEMNTPFSWEKVYGIRFTGDHTALEDLNVKLVTSTQYPSAGILGGTWPITLEDVLIKNVKWHSDPGLTQGSNMQMIADRFEITGCVGEREWTLINCNDVWIHDNTFYGAPYQHAGATVRPRASDQLVIERNSAATMNWPNQGGNVQYLELIPPSQLPSTIWCIRLVYMEPLSVTPAAASCVNSYIAHNQTSDVAKDDNQSEQILFHSGGGMFCQVATNDGNTLTIRTRGGEAHPEPDSAHVHPSARARPLRHHHGGSRTRSGTQDRRLYGDHTDGRELLARRAGRQLEDRHFADPQRPCRV